jgi:hypothetical protein
MLGTDIGAAVFTVLPALVFEVGSATHGTAAIRRWPVSIDLRESSEFDGGERGEFSQGGLAQGVRVGWGVHGLDSI